MQAASPGPTATGGASTGTDAAQRPHRSTLMDATNATRTFSDIKGGIGAPFHAPENPTFVASKATDTPSQRTRRRTATRPRTSATPVRNLNSTLQAAGSELPTPVATPEHTATIGSQPSLNTSTTTPPTGMDWSPEPSTIADTPAPFSALKGVDLNTPYPVTATPAQHATPSAFFSAVKEPAPATSIKDNSFSHTGAYANHATTPAINPKQLDNLFNLAGSGSSQQGGAGINPLTAETAGAAGQRSSPGGTAKAAEAVGVNGVTSSTTAGMNGTATPGRKYRSVGKGKAAVNYNDMGLSAGLRSSGDLTASLSSLGSSGSFGTANAAHGTAAVLCNPPAHDSPIAEQFSKAATTKLPSSDSENDGPAPPPTVPQAVSSVDPPSPAYVNDAPHNAQTHTSGLNLTSHNVAAHVAGAHAARAATGPVQVANEASARAEAQLASAVPGMVTPRGSSIRRLLNDDPPEASVFATPHAHRAVGLDSFQTGADAGGMSPRFGTPGTGNPLTPMSARKTHLRAVRKNQKGLLGEDTGVAQPAEVRLSQSGLKLFDDINRQDRTNGAVGLRLNLVDLTDSSGPSSDALGTSRTVESRPPELNLATPRGTSRPAAQASDIPHWLKNAVPETHSQPSTLPSQPSAFFPSTTTSQTAPSVGVMSSVSNTTTFTDASQGEISSATTAGFHTAGPAAASATVTTASTTSTDLTGSQQLAQTALPNNTARFASSQNLPAELVAAASVPLPTEPEQAATHRRTPSFTSTQGGPTHSVDATAAAAALPESVTSAARDEQTVNAGRPAAMRSGLAGRHGPAGTAGPSGQSASAAQPSQQPAPAASGAAAGATRRPVPTVVGWAGIGLKNEEDGSFSAGPSSTRSEATSAAPKKANTGTGGGRQTAGHTGAKPAGNAAAAAPAGGTTWQPGQVNFAMGGTPQRSKPAAQEPSQPGPFAAGTAPSTTKPAVPKFNDPAPAASHPAHASGPASGPSSGASSGSTFMSSGPSSSVPSSPPQPTVTATAYSVPETTPTGTRPHVAHEWRTPVDGRWNTNLLFGASSSDSSPASKFTSPINLNSSTLYPNPFAASATAPQADSHKPAGGSAGNTSSTPAKTDLDLNAAGLNLNSTPAVNTSFAFSTPLPRTDYQFKPDNPFSQPKPDNPFSQSKPDNPFSQPMVNNPSSQPHATNTFSRWKPDYPFSQSNPNDRFSHSQPNTSSSAASDPTTSTNSSSNQADSNLSNTAAEATISNTVHAAASDHTTGMGGRKGVRVVSPTTDVIRSSMEPPPAKMHNRQTQAQASAGVSGAQHPTSVSHPTAHTTAAAAGDGSNVRTGADALKRAFSSSGADPSLSQRSGVEQSVQQGSSSTAQGTSDANVAGSAYFGAASGSAMIGKGAKAPKVPSLNLDSRWSANVSEAKFAAGVQSNATPRATPRSARGKDRGARRTQPTTSIPFNLTPHTFSATSANPFSSQHPPPSTPSAPAPGTATTSTDPAVSQTAEQIEKLSVHKENTVPESNHPSSTDADRSGEEAVPQSAIKTPISDGPVPFTPSPIPAPSNSAAHFSFGTATKPDTGSFFSSKNVTPFTFRLNNPFGAAAEVQPTPHDKIFTGGDNPKNMVSPVMNDVHMAGSTPEPAQTADSAHRKDAAGQNGAAGFGNGQWGSSVQFGASAAVRTGHAKPSTANSSSRSSKSVDAQRSTHSASSAAAQSSASQGFSIPAGREGKSIAGSGASPVFEFSALPNKEEKALKQAVDKARAASSMFKGRANYSYQSKKYTEAEVDYGRAIQELESLPPPGKEVVRCDLAVLYSNRAGARLMQGKVNEALQDSLHSTQLDPTFPRAYGRAITCHVRLGNMEEALSLLGEALKNLNTPSSKQELGDKKEELRGLHKMKQKLLEAVALDMTQEQIAKLLEESKAAFEKMSDCVALQIVHTALQLRCAQYAAVLNRCKDAGTVPWQWWLLLQVKYLEGDLTEALKVAEQGSQLLASADSNALDPRQLAGIKLPSQQELSTLVGHIKELMLLKNQGNEAVGAKRWQQAVDKYTSAIALQPPLPFSAVLHCNRALAHSNLEKHVEALADAGRAKALNPSYAKAYSRLASFLAEMKRADVAVATLESMMEQCGAGMDVSEKGTVQERLQEHRSKAKREKTPNHYQFLDLQKTCSEEDVRKAYKKMALRYHPDKALSSCKFGLQLGDMGLRLVIGSEVEQRLHKEASCLFSYIGQAHEELSDKTRRRKVDMSLSAENDLADIFASSCSFNTHNAAHQNRTPANYYNYSNNTTRNPYGGTSYYSTSHASARPSYHDAGYSTGYAARNNRPARPAAGQHRTSNSGGYGASTSGPTRFTTSTGSGGWWNSGFADDDDDEWESDDDRWG